MNPVEWAILSADLRHRLIPCGNCDFDDEEDDMNEKIPHHEHDPPQHIIQQLSRHEAWIHEIRESSTRMIAEQGTDLKWMREHIEKLGAVIDKIDARQDRMESELSKHNQFQARVRKLEENHEALPEEFVPRSEFDGAIKSVRETLEDKTKGLSERFTLLIWIVGGGFGIMFTALGFMIFGV